MDRSYLALLRVPAARRALAGLVAAWLSFGMVALVVLLQVQRATGSATAAGLGVAAFAIGAGALAPVRGRAIDRRGARLWLPVFAGGYACSLLALALLARARAPAAALVGLAGLAGLSAPPLVAATRGAWTTIVAAPLVRRAYALTSLVGDAGMVTAPVVGALLFTWSPLAALLLCAAAAVVAALLIAALVPPPAQARERRDAAPLVTTRLRVLLLVSVALGCAFGLVEVAVPAAAIRWDAAALAGVLLGAFALGSVVGGLWFGRRSWGGTAEQRYLVAALLLALALAAPVLASGPASLAALLLVAGLAWGPATISLFESLDELAPGRGTEALTWVTSAEALGIAGGAAAAGLVTARVGAWAPFALASLVLGIPAAAALVARGVSPEPAAPTGSRPGSASRRP